MSRNVWTDGLSQWWQPIGAGWSPDSLDIAAVVCVLGGGAISTWQHGSSPWSALATVAAMVLAVRRPTLRLAVLLFVLGYVPRFDFGQLGARTLDVYPVDLVFASILVVFAVSRPKIHWTGVHTATCAYLAFAGFTTLWNVIRHVLPSALVAGLFWGKEVEYGLIFAVGYELSLGLSSRARLLFVDLMAIGLTVNLILDRMSWGYFSAATLLAAVRFSTVDVFQSAGALAMAFAVYAGMTWTSGRDRLAGSWRMLLMLVVLLVSSSRTSFAAAMVVFAAVFVVSRWRGRLVAESLGLLAGLGVLAAVNVLSLRFFLRRMIQGSSDVAQVVEGTTSRVTAPAVGNVPAGLRAASPSASVLRPTTTVQQIVHSTGPDTTVAGRINIQFKVLWNTFRASPIIGNGKSRFVIGTDQGYMRQLVETGIIGLGLFLWILWNVWVYADRAVHRANPFSRLDEGIAQGVKLAVIVACIINLPDAFFAIEVPAVAFWLVVALGLSVSMKGSYQ